MCHNVGKAEKCDVTWLNLKAKVAYQIQVMKIRPRWS
jgi:hypothetical protein